MNNRFNLLLSFVLIISCSSISLAQTGSPYSQFGFGDLTGSGFGQSQAMGRIGLGLRSSEHLNNTNPASYSALDSMTVIYELGLRSVTNKVENSENSITKKDAKIDYMALGFRINRFWYTGFGLTPASRVDYNFKNSVVDPIDGLIETYYYGSGGFNKLYWINSFQLTKNLSIGIETQYLFGAIDRISSILFMDPSSTAINVKTDYQLNVFDVNFLYGVQYSLPLIKDYQLILGATYQHKMNLNSKENILSGTTNSVDHTGIYYSELIDTLTNVQDQRGSIIYPGSFGAGFTLTRPNKLIVGFDVLVQNWNEMKIGNLNDSLKNLVSFRTGIEYTPNNTDINHYLKRVHYRLGGHYTQTQLELKGERINDYGISFGAGLPLRNTTTSFNITCEVGRRGTTNQNLLQETYGIISLNLSLSDIWFIKRKFK